MKIRHLFKQARKVKLEEAKKAQIQKELLSFIENNPISPEREPISSINFLSLFVKYRYVPMLAVLVLLLGTGSSIASEISLPGEALYPVKTRINDRMKDLINRSPQEKVALQIDLIEERIKEAEVLAEREGLSEELAEQLNVVMKTRMAYMNQHIANIDPENAQSSRDNFEQKLIRHQEFLSDISQSQEKAEALNLILENLEYLKKELKSIEAETLTN